MVLCMIAGGTGFLLVLGEVVSPSSTTRWLVVVAGGVSPVLLAAHMLSAVTSLYRSHRGDLADGRARSGQ